MESRRRSVAFVLLLVALLIFSGAAHASYTYNFYQTEFEPYVTGATPTDPIWEVSLQFSASVTEVSVSGDKEGWFAFYFAGDPVSGTPGFINFDSTDPIYDIASMLDLTGFVITLSDPLDQIGLTITLSSGYETPVPLPATALLLGSGLLGVGWRLRKRQRP